MTNEKEIRETVCRLADDMLIASEFEVRAATAALFERLRANPELFAAVAEPLVRGTCYEAVAKQMRARGLRITTPNARSPDELRAGIAATGKATARAFQHPNRRSSGGPE